MTSKKFMSEFEKIKRKNIEYIRKQKLESIKLYKKKNRFPSTSKMLIWAVVLLCVEVVVFCEYVFIQTKDTSFIYALAGVPTVLVPAILSYNNKSMHENTSGGIVYETAIQNLNTDSSGEAVG